MLLERMLLERMLLECLLELLRERMHLALLALLEVELQQPNIVVNRFPYMVCPLLETQGLQ